MTRFIIAAAWLLYGNFTPLSAQDSVYVTVADLMGNPVPGHEIRLNRAIGGATTDGQGKAQVPLPIGFSRDVSVAPSVVNHPELVMISPCGKGLRLTGEDSEVSIEIVVAKSGDRAALRNRVALAGMIECFLRAGSPSTSPNYTGYSRRRREALERVAGSFGFTAREFELAVREWAPTATDHYERGLAALLEQRPEDARSELAERVQEIDRAASAGGDRSFANEMADASLFLGMAYLALGANWAAVESFETASAMRPDDGELLTCWAESLIGRNEYVEAERLLRQGIEVDERLFGVGGGSSAEALDALAFTVAMKGYSPE